MCVYVHVWYHSELKLEMGGDRGLLSSYIVRCSPPPREYSLRGGNGFYGLLWIEKPFDRHLAEWPAHLFTVSCFYGNCPK